MDGRTSGGAAQRGGETGPAGGTEESRRAAGIALIIAGAASNQVGAGIGALAFPVLGPVGVVAVRQIVAGVVLLPVVRPAIRAVTRRQWSLLVALAAVFGLMNLSLYLAIERIGLGLAVTLEFLGPLMVAILSSRRRIDLLCALAAGAGVVLLAGPGRSGDLLGIGLGLVAAASWAAYILLNREVGRALPGLQGTTIACGITAAVWLPIALCWFALRPPTLSALAIAVACGVLCSVVPYAADVAALRRVPIGAYGTFASVHPVLAALAGWAVLDQRLAPIEWLAIGLIVVSNVLVTLRSARR